jgi:SAM-dependent methyltransferase
MPLLTRVLQAYRVGGMAGIAHAVTSRVRPSRARCAPRVRADVTGKTGLEVGGPSHLFTARGLVPVYPHARRIDNVNFARQTAWETVADHFQPDPALEPGAWHVGELTALPVATGAYDFALASHTLEHTANPLRALRELHRVLRRGGLLLVALPDPRHTFDHRRPVTTLDHLRADAQRDTSEADLTHLPEIVALHDLTRDPGAPQDPAAFEARCRRNADNRCLHHHVFDLPLLRDLLTDAGFRPVASETLRPDNLLCLAERR